MGLVVVDSSVLIALLDGTDVLHAAATDALAAAWEQAQDVVIPVIAYAEALVHPLATGGDRLAQVEEFFATQKIVPHDRRAAREGARLRAQHRWLRLPDALIIATGLVLDADEVLTGDERWRAVSPIVRRLAPASP